MFARSSSIYGLGTIKAWSHEAKFEDEEHIFILFIHVLWVILRAVSHLSR